MRTSLLRFFLAAVSLAAPAFCSDLSTYFDSNFGIGYPTDGTPTPGFCVQPNCVLFSGILLDNDTDFSILSLDSIGIEFSGSNPSTGFVTLDDTTFYDNVGAPLIGDPNWAADAEADGFLQNFYQGPIFGIDIAPGTVAGEYDATILFNTSGGTDDTGSGQTFTQDIVVVVAPEPSAAGMLFAGALSWVTWRGVKRKWRSSQASR